jgi:NADPH-dependent 7-cyano-7-deazaguanine reductase QueF-like protein
MIRIKVKVNKSIKLYINELNQKKKKEVLTIYTHTDRDRDTLHHV